LLSDVLAQAASINSSIYSTRTVAAASIIPGSFTAIRTSGYSVAGDGGAAIYVHASGSTLGGFQSADGQWWQLESNPAVVNVLQYGADPTGVADSGPAFRAAVGSNRVIVIPPGNYLFKSSVFDSIVNPNPAALQAIAISSQSNFTIFGYGATLTMDASIAATPFFGIADCTNFNILGIRFEPSSSGLGPSDFNSCIGMISCVQFNISDIYVGTHLKNQAFFGNYLVNGVLRHWHMSGGQGVDIANVLHCLFDGWNADGFSTVPNASGLWFGNNMDLATNPLRNHTGYTINETDHLTISRCNISNYTTGVFISSGHNIKVIDNTFHDMPGTGVGPVGIYLTYNNGGNGDSTGHPLKGVQIIGNTFITIGHTTTGEGILIDPAAIVNADVLSDVIITNNHFSDIVNAGVIETSNSHLVNFVWGEGNTFTAVSNPIDASLLPVMAIRESAVVQYAGDGYSLGSGGQVTQLTSKATTVILNKINGQITLNGATLNTATIVSFTLTNSTIGIGDNIIINHVSGGTVGAYSFNAAAGNGSATITIRNNTAGNLSEALVLTFSVIKGATN
jgi:hypothetical protein